MTTTPLPRLHLGFGWSRGLIPGIKAAWGARMIVTQDGGVDFLHDRTSTAGDDELVTKTLDWLNAEPKSDPRGAKTNLGRAIVVAGEMLKSGWLNTREAGGAVIHEDGFGAVIANTNASHGYLYVSAFLFEARPDNCPTRGLEIALRLVSEDDVAEISP